MAVTSHDKQWERSHSIWIVWTFLLQPWIAFFYIAIRARRGRWGLWGLLYLIPYIFGGAPANSWLSDVGAVLLLVFGIGGIVHAFRVRKEYLMCLEAVQKSRSEIDADLRQRVQTEYGLHPQEPTSSASSGQPTFATSRSTRQDSPQLSAQPSNPVPYPPSETFTVDLNSSSERELATLPGIGLIRAKRAVNVRGTKGGFRSVEDFGEALNLRSDVVERIRPLVYVSPPQQTQRPNSSPGRIVDY